MYRHHPKTPVKDLGSGVIRMLSHRRFVKLALIYNNKGIIYNNKGNGFWGGGGCLKSLLIIFSTECTIGMVEGDLK